MRRFGVFIEAHPIYFWIGVAVALWLIGFAVTGDPSGAFGFVREAVGESLRPIGETR